MEQTRRLLLRQYQLYPAAELTDLFKFLFQSAFGCEHLVSSPERAIDYIRKEYDASTSFCPPEVTELDGDYCRVSLSCLQNGLAPETLGKLFCRSSKHEPDGKKRLTEMLTTAREMIAEGALPFSAEVFEYNLTLWKENDFCPVHHSETFRNAYHPAYRVIAKEYVRLLPLLARIDQALAKSSCTLAIEGGSASGKSTLSTLLSELYDCNVIHMDDFFLRPEQRTADRLREIGGNIDRERFLTEVLHPLSESEPFSYRPFDCSTQALREPIQIPRKPLTVIEGVYSMHPAFSDCYDLSVFLDIAPATQKQRVEKRNSPFFAQKYLETWIPMENRYFTETDAKNRCTLSIPEEFNP
ncbi:MAG: hypothetical protein J6S15_03790 [Clostridia bacterium]|nr:hypothetical protein [Clostridia bacterium]